MNSANAPISAKPAPASRTEPVLRVGGLTRLSTTDYPGQLAAVVFCQGCPWACRYCHNPHLIPGRANGAMEWSEVLAFLARRRGLLDGVVLSGGEPTLQAGLAQACQAVRGMGFRVGLHTAGPYPERLARVLPWLDWVGMDVKAPFDDYDAITGVPGSGEQARESLGLLLESGVAYEIRTTVHTDLLPPHRLTTLAHQLAASGVRHYVVQEFRAQGCADRLLGARKMPAFAADEMAAEYRSLFQGFSIRRA